MPLAFSCSSTPQTYAFLLDFDFLLRNTSKLEIDTIYQIERQDQLVYKTLPHTLFFSPTIIIFSILTLLLPLSGVFAPGSLAVTTKNSLDHVGPCMIPSGNLSASDTPDSTSLFAVDHQGQWFGSSSRASALTLQWFVDQRIPDLPQACGPNCRYKVHVPSFAFQCTPNPSSLPYGQASMDSYTQTLWNGTLAQDQMSECILHCMVFLEQSKWNVRKRVLLTCSSSI
jgi:hypothetical protein